MAFGLQVYRFTAPSPWLGVLLVLGALAVALVLFRWLQVRGKFSPEGARKGVHIAMGAITLSFPFLFSRPEPVVVLALLAVGAMMAIRYVPMLRDRLGGVLHGVERRSYGEIYYPIAVCVLFLVAADTPVLYFIPLLLLGLADPAAALIGIRHGFAPYDTVEGTKSREGSVAFAAVAFLGVHVPLLLLTETGRAESLLVACIVAILATILEAVSWRGLDNLFVPLGAYVLLDRLLSFSASLLTMHLVVLLGLLVGAAVWRRQTTLGGGAVAGAVLVAYVTWAVGGTLWLGAPLFVYLTYTRLWPGARDPEARLHTVQNVFSVVAVGVAWLFLARAADAPALLVPYTLSYTAALALLGVDYLRRHYPDWSKAEVVRVAAVRSAAVQVPILVLAEGLRETDSLLMLAACYAGLGLAAAALAAWALVYFEKEIEHGTGTFESRFYRSTLVAVASALGLLVSFRWIPWL